MDTVASRLGFFVFFDPQSIVDPYVLHLIDAFRPNFSRFIVISNSQLDVANTALLQQHCDCLYFRENKGLDAGAFKDGMFHFCGREEIQKYDEVVLINDTFFGPVHSFEDMFREMSCRDLDFWGMSAGYPSDENWLDVKYGYTPAHIQTFFTAFRRNMVASQAFYDYWNQYDENLSQMDAVVSQHETVMTKHFEDLGFRWDIYADTKKYNSEERSENFNIYYQHPYTMMKDMHFPVLKKKVLSANIPQVLYLNDLEEPREAMEFIRDHSDYDENLIWDNVLRLYHTTDLYHTLHLNYVLPSSPVDCPAIHSGALICHVANPFFANRFCDRVRALSGEMDVFMIPGDNSVAEILRQNLAEVSNVQILEESGSADMFSFLVHGKSLAKQYTYLGFIHDELNPEHYPATVPESTVSGYLQNAARDGSYIRQIVNCFEANPRLGVLGTPFPIHHSGFGNYGNEWGDYFEETLAIAKERNLTCNLSGEKAPFAITGVFWCRTDALKDLWKTDGSTEVFDRFSARNEAFRRILPYAAQSAGYYSGIVMHTDYASMRITSQQYMLDQMVTMTRNHWGFSEESFMRYLEQISFSKEFFVKAFKLFLERSTPEWFTKLLRSCYRLLRKE